MNKLKRIEKLENEVRELENEVRELENELYEILDNQKINELSKKYKVKINFKYRYGSYFLKINNDTVVDTNFITDCHDYIQSGEFERDIKAFLYKKIRGNK